MEEHYPSLAEMLPRSKNKSPISWKDGWNVFRWPQLGSVAPDEYVIAHSNQPQTTLHTLMDQTFTLSDKQFFILLFRGVQCGDACVDLKLFADALETRFVGVLDAFGVTPFYDHERYDAVNNILGDTDGTCQKAYGATGMAIYVMNREKKVVWKSSGLMKDKLYLYLNSHSKSV